MEIFDCKSPEDMLKSHSLTESWWRMLVCRLMLPRALLTSMFPTVPAGRYHKR